LASSIEVKTGNREKSVPKGLYSGQDLLTPKNKPNKKYGFLVNGNIEKSKPNGVDSTKNLPLGEVSEENVLQQQLKSPTDLEIAALKGVGVVEFLKKREAYSGYGLKSSK
jgi:hypothetical protein